MANTGWFAAGSSPTTEMYCEATASTSGSVTTVNCTVKSRHVYSSGFMGTGYVITVYAKSNLGGQGSVEHHKTTDSWSGTAEHTSTFSFTFSPGSATSATITFWSTANTSSAYKFSDKTVTVSFGAGTIEHDMFVTVYSSNYLETMCQAPYSLPTWSEAGGQNDIVWYEAGAGSWTRGGITYNYAHGHTHNNASLDDQWNIHIYSGNTGLGALQFYPRIYIKYNANGGSSTPQTQTKYIGNSVELAAAISRTHYTFEGWDISSTATTPSWSAGYYVDIEAWNSCTAPFAYNNGWTELIPGHPNQTSNTVNLYAIWKANSYQVSYNANGGSSTPAAQSATYPNSLTLASAISRANGSTAGYAVSYNANGGSGAPSAQTSGNRTITYTFSKWAAGSTSSSVKFAAGASYTPTQDVTMYATWSSSTSSNSSWTCSSTKPTRAGYTFLGWSTSSTATTATYTAGSTYTITGALTLYAVWKLDQAQIRVKTGGAYKLGKAYIKVGGEWKKATKVYVKVNGAWKLCTNT